MKREVGSKSIGPDKLIVEHVQQSIDIYKQHMLSPRDVSKLNKLGEILEGWKETESGFIVRTKKLQYSPKGETVMDAQVKLDSCGIQPTLIFRAKSQKISEEALHAALTQPQSILLQEVLNGFETDTSDFRFTSKGLSSRAALEFGLEGKKERRGKKGVASSYPLDHVQIRFEWKQGTKEIKTKGFIMNEKNIKPAKSSKDLDRAVSLVDFALMRQRIINLAKELHKPYPIE